MYHGVVALTAEVTRASVAPGILSAALGALLIVGLWTPLVGSLAAIGAALWGIFSPADTGCCMLLATLCAALALLGPGRWSVDARLFGWRRVEIRNGIAHRKRREPRPK